MSGTKSVFVVTDAEGGTTYCNVEELVREHYKVREYIKIRKNCKVREHIKVRE